MLREVSSATHVLKIRFHLKAYIEREIYDGLARSLGPRHCRQFRSRRHFDCLLLDGWTYVRVNSIFLRK